MKISAAFEEGIGILPAKAVLDAYAFDLPNPVPVVWNPPDVLDLYFNLFNDSFLLSNLFIEHILNVSVMRFVLIVISSGLSGERLGDKLTSINHGFKSESSKISNPKTSKQFNLYIPFFFMACRT